MIADDRGDDRTKGRRGRYLRAVLAALFLGAASLCGACGSTREDQPNLEICRETEAKIAADHARLEAEAKLLAERNPDGIDVLCLSAGGRNGAWGAGVLSGWREHPSMPRPADFEVITGVSIGSLIATYAYLGDEPVKLPAFDTPLPPDEILRIAFTTTKTEDVLEERGMISAFLFSDSLYDNSPYEGVLEKYVPDVVVDRVAAIADLTGRMLLVATVDADCGRFKIWDMVGIAREKNYTRFRKVLYAATAMPVFFSPVFIDGHMHVDAAARERIFLRDVFVPVCATAPARPTRVWAIVNASVSLSPKVVDDELMAMAWRTLELTGDEAMIGNLFRLKHVAERAGAEFRVSYIPRDQTVDGGTADFTPERTTELWKRGKAWAQTTEWSRDVPVVSDLH